MHRSQPRPNRPGQDAPDHIKSLKLDQVNVFPVPIFQMAVPALVPHHDAIIDAFRERIESGALPRNARGFGYQTPANLLDERAWPDPWFREILAPSFRAASQRILTNAYTDWEPGMKRRWVNTMTIAWGVVQTSDTDGDNPWHTHLPALLSGCYYVRMSSRQDEGNFQFMNPLAANLFQPRIGELRPREGHMLIFPSFLNHRPSLSPHLGDDLRVSLCLDGHFRAELID